MQRLILLGTLACAAAVQQHGFWNWSPFGKRDKAGKTAKASGGDDVRPAVANETGAPTEPGCYKRLPAGCWRFAKKSRMAEWSHDAVAEESPFDAQSCRKRKIVWDKFCQVVDTEMLFVPGQFIRKVLTTTEPAMTQELEEDTDLVTQPPVPSTTQHVVRQTPPPVEKVVTMPPTTASTTRAASVEQIVEGIQKREKLDDFFQAVDKEAEDEFKQEKLAKEKNEALKRQSNERRNAIMKAAAMGEATATARKDTMSKAQAALDRQQGLMDQDTKDLEERTAALTEAERAAKQVSEDLLSIRDLTVRSEEEINKTQEEMDMASAEGREIDDELTKHAVEAKDAKARAEKLVEEKEAMIEPARQRVADAKKTLVEAEAKLRSDKQPLPALDKVAQDAVKQYEAARRDADQHSSIAKKIEDIEGEEKRAQEETKAIAEKALSEEQEAKKKGEADEAARKAREEAAKDAAEEAAKRAAEKDEWLQKRLAEEAKQSLDVELEKAKKEDAASDAALEPSEGAAEAAAEAPPKEEPSAKVEQEDELPAEPGCYLKMPTGCQDRMSKLSRWRHDKWAEEHQFDSTGCKDRKGVWDRYCEREDVEVRFVDNKTSLLQSGAGWPWSRRHPKTKETAKAAADADSAAAVPEVGYPSEPGCYMRMPSGCPKNPMRTQLWRHDAWAEQHGLGEAGCKERTEVWNKFCGAEDAKVFFMSNASAVPVALALA